jgi:hypothetical protein
MADAAAELGIDRSTLHRHWRVWGVKFWRPGPDCARWVITRADLDDYKREQKARQR